MRDKILVHELSEEFDTLELYPLSDLHVGDPAADLDAFERFVAHVMAAPNRYLLSIGDAMNNATKSSVSNVYNETCPPREQKKWLIQRLKPLKDRILVMLDGNHEYRNTKDVDNSITYDIADNIGIPSRFREDEAVLKITFGQKRNKKRNCYSVYCIHGNGGGKRPGATVNNIELLALSIDCDIFCMGHAHKRLAYKNTFRRVDLQNNRVYNTERLFVVSSSWCSFSGYAARKMLTPSAKGSVPIILSGREKRADAVV